MECIRVVGLLHRSPTGKLLRILANGEPTHPKKLLLTCLKNDGSLAAARHVGRKLGKRGGKPIDHEINPWLLSTMSGSVSKILFSQIVVATSSHNLAAPKLYAHHSLEGSHSVVEAAYVSSHIQNHKAKGMMTKPTRNTTITRTMANQQMQAKADVIAPSTKTTIATRIARTIRASQ